MKSARARTVQVIKRTNLGHMPTFLSMGHRFLEKAQPDVQGTEPEFTIPLDHFRISVRDEILQEVESITFRYRRPLR